MFLIFFTIIMLLSGFLTETLTDTCLNQNSVEKVSKTFLDGFDKELTSIFHRLWIYWAYAEMHICIYFSFSVKYKSLNFSLSASENIYHFFVYHLLHLGIITLKVLAKLMRESISVNIYIHIIYNVVKNEKLMIQNSQIKQIFYMKTHK